MLITSDEFLYSGLPVSTDITAEEIEMAIRTVEQLYVKQCFGDKWSEIVADPEEYTDIIEGTDEIAGLKLAEYHLVFAYLLYDEMRLTRFHAIVKNDEHSDNPSREDLLAVAKHHWEIGTTFINECSKILQVDTQKVLNNLIFNELYI